ncbi:MAG: hypothetical protein LBT59_17990, partial [Clostridiales bacterium]|nr:hypothetical protein [Clostridiales bacterium]
LDFASYEALEIKDPNTLYFTSDTHEVFLGENSYVTEPHFISYCEESEIGFYSSENGYVIGEPKLSYTGSSLEIKSDGLYVPPPRINKPDAVPGHFIMEKADGQIKDSGLSLTKALSKDSTNDQVPSAAAVYEALTRVAPFWESIDTPEDLADWKAHRWRNMLPRTSIWMPTKIGMYEPSYFIADGMTVRFCFLFNFDVYRFYQWGYDRILLNVPKFLCPPCTMSFQGILCYYDYDEPSNKGNAACTLIIDSGRIRFGQDHISIPFENFGMHFWVQGAYPLRNTVFEKGVITDGKYQ